MRSTFTLPLQIGILPGRPMAVAMRNSGWSVSPIIFLFLAFGAVTPKKPGKYAYECTVRQVSCAPGQDASLLDGMLPIGRQFAPDGGMSMHRGLGLTQQCIIFCSASF